MWEDEFKEFSKQQSLVTPARDPTRRPSLDTSVSKETFEQRLKSMQEKMELQLVEQLKSLEHKIGSPGGIVSGGQNSFVDDTTVELLRSEVAKKELEILKLNKQIIDLQEQLSKGGGGGSTGAAEAKDPNEVEMWVSSSKATKMEEDIKSKTGKGERFSNENLKAKSENPAPRTSHPQPLARPSRGAHEAKSRAADRNYIGGKAPRGHGEEARERTRDRKQPQGSTREGEESKGGGHGPSRRR